MSPTALNQFFFAVDGPAWFVHAPNSTIGKRAKTNINRSSLTELQKKIALYMTGRERIVYYAKASKYINARVKRA